MLFEKDHFYELRKSMGIIVAEKMDRDVDLQIWEFIFYKTYDGMEVVNLVEEKLKELIPTSF